MIEHEFEGRRRVTSAEVAGFAAALGTVGSGADTPAGLIDHIRRLEQLKGAAAAAQARLTAAFAAGQRCAQRAAGVPGNQVGKGIAAQVALARRDSPARGGQHLGLAEALTAELPHTLAALQAGRISEWRATLVARETACLSVEHRAQVDAELAARPGGMGAMGDRTIAAEARRAGYRLDPYAVTDRARKAAADRRVSLRPAPDAMAWFGALLPLAQGVAAYAALSQDADARRAHGDERTRGQVMADTMIERITGQHTAPAVPVQVHLVMTDRALLDGDNEPAELDGHGPLPAPLARSWLRGDDHQLAGKAQVWVRRLYTRPDTGALVAMDSHQRCFDGQLRRFIITADRRCRTPGATPRSATSTTRYHSPTAGRPPQTTAKGYAKRATTPRKPTTGTPSATPTGSSKPSPPPNTATTAAHHPSSATPPQPSGPHRGSQ
jgi:hypothetical protein